MGRFGARIVVDAQQAARRLLFLPSVRRRFARKRPRGFRRRGQWARGAGGRGVSRKFLQGASISYCVAAATRLPEATNFGCWTMATF